MTMNRLYKILTLLLFIVVVSSCRSVSVDGNIAELRKYDTISVIQFVVSPPYTPIIPILASSIYNNSVEEIVPDILYINRVKANELAEYTANFFKDSTSIVLLCGQEYFNSPNYKKLKEIVQVYKTDLDNEDFIEIAIPENSYNFFNVYEDFSLSFFEDIPDMYVPNKTISTIANELNQEVVAIIVTGNVPTSSSFFSSKWGTVNRTEIYFYRRNGILLLSATLNSEEIKAKGNSTKGYSFILDTYKTNLSDIADELFKKKLKK